jgi:hypothetical protein
MNNSLHARLPAHLGGLLLASIILFSAALSLTWRKVGDVSVVLDAVGCDILLQSEVMPPDPSARRPVRCRINSVAARPLKLYARPLDPMYRLDVQTVGGVPRSIYLQRSLVISYE